MRRLALPVWAFGLVIAVARLPHLATHDDPAFTVARGVAVALAIYLLAATALNAALALARVRVRLPGAALIVALSLGPVALGAPAFAATAAPAPAPVMTTTAAGPPVMHRLADPVPAAPTPTPAASATPLPSASPAPTKWTVRHGDCFWSIAAQVLTASQGRAPSEAAVVPYWHQLIEANRPRLADPAHPGLLFAGQILTIPSPSPA